MAPCTALLVGRREFESGLFVRKLPGRFVEGFEPPSRSCKEPAGRVFPHISPQFFQIHRALAAELCGPEVRMESALEPSEPEVRRALALEPSGPVVHRGSALESSELAAGTVPLLECVEPVAHRVLVLESADKVSEEFADKELQLAGRIDRAPEPFHFAHIVAPLVRNRLAGCSARNELASECDPFCSKRRRRVDCK